MDAVTRTPLQRWHGAHDRLGMTGVHAGDRDVADDLTRLHAHEVDRPWHRVRVGDGLRDVGERAALLGAYRRMVKP
jgi:hypothetical protein